MEIDVNKIIEKIRNKIIKSYNLNKKEAEEFRTATYNYDYEINDGTVFTTKESVERLFTKEDGETQIPFTEKQLKAIADFIYETEDFYNLGGIDKLFEQYTKKTILDILNNTEKKQKRDNKVR